MGGIHVGLVYGLLAASLFVFVLGVGALLELRLTRRTSRATGTRPGGGYAKPSASTTVKGRGTLTPATDTSAGCSFYSQPGLPWGDGFVQTSHRLGNSYTARTSSIGATGLRGGSGEPRGSAD